MSATYQRDLEYSEILNFHKVINESPYHDKNGKKTVVLCSKFLKHFYKSFMVKKWSNSNEDISCTNVIRRLTEYLCDEYNEPICKIRNYRLTPEQDKELKKLFKMCGRGYANAKPLVLCVIDDSSSVEFDVDSAVSQIIEYTAQNPTNKYVVAYTRFASLNAYSDKNKLNIYDFLNDYNYDLYVLKENKVKEENNKLNTKVNSCNKDSNESCDDNIKTEVVTIKEAVSLDKFVFDDNITFKQMNEVFKFINNAIRFFDAQGVNWRKKLNFSTSYIDDTCGYPIVKDIDDIPSPFPEEIDGDEKLANL